MKVNFKLILFKYRFSRQAKLTTEKHGINMTIFNGCFVPIEERNGHIYEC